MAGEWYYAREGESVGPTTLEELKRLADSGELQRTDLVWTAPMDEWDEAGYFEELFAPVSEPLVPPAPPEPTAPPAEPQVRYHQGRDQDGYQGGHQDHGSSAEGHIPQDDGMPSIVLIGFILTCVLFLFCAPTAFLGSILCLIGLPEARRRQEGKGLAIAGILIGFGALLLSIIGLGMFLVLSVGEATMHY